jgi:hypothetical protein
LVNPKVYIGACEYEVIMAKTKKVTEKYLGKPKVKNGRRHFVYGRCSFDGKHIVVRHDLRNGQDRYETLLHEGIHGICHEHSELPSLAILGEDETAVTILSKQIASFLRQIRDNGVLER